MKTQIRIYTIKDGELNTFLEEWNIKIKPLRINIGFKVTHAWIEKAKNKFVWMLTLENEDDWDKLESKYQYSEERKSMFPNTARNILAMENSFINIME